MDLRKTLGSGIVVTGALVVAAMLYTFFMASAGMDTAIEIGLSIGAFLFAVLFFVVWSGARKLKVVKQVEG